MGTLYTATCPCGFRQYDLLQGHGISTRDIGYELYQCEHCHALVNYEHRRAADSLFSPLHCPECKATLVRLTLEAAAQPRPCPECKGPTLALSIVGLWD